MRRMLTAVCGLAAAAGVARPAQAGLFQDLYRGLDLLSTPSGAQVFPLPDGGFGNGQRQGRLRIVPDRAGQGYTLEFDRTFGVDTRGRPEVLDLGGYELELNGQIQATAGFTRRGMLVGNADFGASNLAYRISNKTGLQDYEMTGTLNVSQQMEINQFGFYDLTLNVSNTNSQLTQDGVLIRDEEDISFDVGPVSVEGNVFFDAIVGILGTLGLDTSGFTALSPKSPIDRITEELRSQFEGAVGIAGMSIERNPTLDLQAAFVGPELPSAGVAGDSITVVPEPGTLSLLVLGGVLCALRRR